MAVNRYSLNGCAFVYTGTGTLGALELLGYTEAGVDMDITENKAEIMTDLYGPMTPQDFQDMGAMVRLVTPMIAYDDAVLAKVMMRGDHTGAGVIATAGLINTAGLVLGIAGYGFRVAIASTFDSPWSFTKAIMRGEGTRLATKVNPFRLELLCWPYAPYTATSAKDVSLWTRTLS